jgi:hypothetical protein
MTNLYIGRSERLAARKLLDETVILKPDDSGLYVLNELGTVIWDAADGATTLAMIVERAICPQFEIDAATALHDATEFVERLRDHNILRVSETPMTSDATTSNEKAS